MLRLAVAALLTVAVATAAAATIKPLPADVRAELKPEFWHKGCPVPLSHLRVLTVRIWGWDNRAHTGQLIVNQDERTLTIDGERAFGSVPRLEQLAEREGSSYVARARRLDEALWEVEVNPL